MFPESPASLSALELANGRKFSFVVMTSGSSSRVKYPPNIHHKLFAAGTIRTGMS